MSKLTVLPLVIITMSAVLACASARHREMAQAARVSASKHPRSRLYSTSLPDL